MKLFKWIKKIFCRHIWTTDCYGIEIILLNCPKCGKDVFAEMKRKPISPRPKI